MDKNIHTIATQATAYFHQLFELLNTMQITDKGGATLDSNHGTQQVVKLLLSVKNNGGKVMVIGNGGSAAIASHIHNDLCKAVGVPALNFTEPSLLTALTNDHGYGCVFEEPIKLWAKPGDLLLAISSSGQSENILRAVQAAATKSCSIVTFSGFKVDNPLRQMGDINFYICASVYGYVELAHQVLAHFLTDCAMESNTDI